MKQPGGKLRDLQRHWYKILEDSGFEDIEQLVRGELVLKQTANHSMWDKDPFDREMDQEYFRLIFHKACDPTTAYRNEVDKLIMQMHADGAKNIDIVRALETRGDPRCRRAVRVIIRKYEMMWNIRKYTRKQLNKYD
jgi:hypothetical protein